MCTVTFALINASNFVLTSNRDESPERTSLVPDIYTHQDAKLLFPKDELAGGTWIGASSKRRVLCLLNGGFRAHERKESYRMSRGVIVKDLLATNDILNAITSFNFDHIEPFTLVIVDWNDALKLFELVWDGAQHHFNELPLQPTVWSSSSLYSEEMKKERQEWFSKFKSDKALNEENLMQFHKTTHLDNEEYGVIMNRGYVKTTSITQVIKTGDLVEMRFHDLKTNQVSSRSLTYLHTFND